MGEAQKKPLVCVTGATGFLASCLVKCLLEKGYYVRASVRDAGNYNKVSHLLDLPGAQERLELREADLLVDGSFDDLVYGCEGVFHTASPVMSFTNDPETDMITPAVNGTLNVLKSCAKASSSIRRVVLTSSTSAMRFKEDYPANSELDESSWSSVDFCKKYKMWYYLAKTMAEKSAWEFAEKNGIHLVTILPSFIVGPVIPLALSSTALDVLGETSKFVLYPRMGYVHVNDVALSHILVFETESAEGRYICSATEIENHKLAEKLSKRYPEYKLPTKFPSSYQPRYYTMNTSKLRALGMEFKTLEEMFDDCVANFQERGLL